MYSPVSDGLSSGQEAKQIPGFLCRQLEVQKLLNKKIGQIALVLLNSESYVSCIMSCTCVLHCSYEHQSGRESVIEQLSAIFTKFPEVNER